jgi:hypothetical protein
VLLRSSFASGSLAPFHSQWLVACDGRTSLATLSADPSARQDSEYSDFVKDTFTVKDSDL